MFGGAKPASNSFGFGSAAAPTATAQPTTGFQFGAPQAQTGFQLGATQPNTSLTFGAAQPNAGLGASQPTTSLSFGTQPAASQGFGGLSFGATAATTAPSLFGSTAPTLSFGATTAAAPSFGLGAATATTTAPTLGFSFGQTAPATAASGTGLSLGTSAAPSLFGATATTSASTLSFGLGSSAPATGLSFGTGLSSSAVPTALSTATSTTASVGLGGVDTSQNKLGLSGTGVPEQKQAKENLLPDVLLQIFNDFQTFIKQQKSMSVEISRSSSKLLKTIQEDIETMDAMLANITNGLVRNSVATEKLKAETAQALSNVEMAQRLREAPTTLGYENGPEQYFADLVSRFEVDAIKLQVQVEDAERHLRAIAQNSAISPHELTLAMRRIHETLVALAARVQNLHLETQGAIEQYRYLRHVYLKEDFPAISKATTPTSWRRPTQRSLAGPTPFSETSGVAISVDALSMLTGSSPQATGASPQGWFGSPAGTAGAGVTTALPTSFLSSPVDNSAGFQLSKPPVGNKRNKR